MRSLDPWPIASTGTGVMPRKRSAQRHAASCSPLSSTTAMSVSAECSAATSDIALRCLSMARPASSSAPVTALSSQWLWRNVATRMRRSFMEFIIVDPKLWQRFQAKGMRPDVQPDPGASAHCTFEVPASGRNDSARHPHSRGSVGAPAGRTPRQDDPAPAGPPRSTDVAVSTLRRHLQLEFRAATGVAADVELAADPARAFPHPAQPPMPGATSLEKAWIDAAAVIAHAHPQLAPRKSEADLDPVRLGVPKGVGQRLACNEEHFVEHLITQVARCTLEDDANP